MGFEKDGKTSDVQASGGASGGATGGATMSPGKLTLTSPKAAPSGPSGATPSASGVLPHTIIPPSAPTMVTGFRTPEEARVSVANPTWDPNATYEGRKPGDKPGAWVEATAAKNAPEAKSVNGDGEKVDKRMVSGSSLDPAKANAGAAYKAGKYIWRMADAAKNIGSKDKDIETLYTAGYALANEIKGGDEPQVELDRKAGVVLSKALGPNAATPDALMEYVRTLGARIAREHANAGDIKRAAPVKAKKPETPPE